jgi:nicotinamide riboside transporter PnuC
MQDSPLYWIITAMSVTGVVLNVKKRRICFLVWIVANGGWIFVNLRHGIYAQAGLFVIYTGLSIWGWFEWGKKRKQQEQPAEEPA